MLEQFEKQNSQEQPNLILMQVDKKIVGAYASHGWSTSDPRQGDSTCFLFNLTQNFRFNAIGGNQFYQQVVPAGSQENNLKFGDTDLVIEKNFKSVKSHISSTHFVFGTDFLQNRIDSIIPDQKEFEPDKIEVWLFSR